MARYTITIGALLILLGVGFYVGIAATTAGAPSLTALIPAFAGAPILLAGLVALQEPLRKHAMHIASVVKRRGMDEPIRSETFEVAEFRGDKVYRWTIMIRESDWMGKIWP